MQNIEIRVKGQIDRDWSDWISGLTITHTTPGETVLTGYLGLQLIAMSSQGTDARTSQGGTNM